MRKRILSFKYAFIGIWAVASSEINFQIHIAAAIIAVSLGFYLDISKNEWCCVLLCFAIVMAAEAFNSAIEKLVDFISPEFHPKAGKIKDIAAGAVLITAIIAAAVGCIVFLAKIIARGWNKTLTNPLPAFHFIVGLDKLGAFGRG